MTSEGRGRGSFQETFASPPARPAERKTNWVPLQAEARRLLPSEPESFVVSAIRMLRATGQPVTPQAIRDRLKAQGRTKAQLSEAA